MRRNVLFLSITTFIFFLIITRAGTPGFSQTISADSLEKETTGKAVDGLMNVSSSLIKDTFVPLTFWQEKDYSLTFVPAYFRIERFYDDPRVEGKDAGGWAAALGGGYALNERLLVYGIAAYQDISGKLSGKMYRDPLPPVEPQMDFRTFFFSPGAGYELLSNKWLSLPLYLGPFIQHYSIDLDIPEESSGGNSIDVNVSGSGLLYGFSGGLAVSIKVLNQLKITPYYIYMRSFNKPEADARIKISTSSPFPLTTGYSESLEVENLSGSMIGLSATLSSSRNLSFSLSIGGYLTSETGWYNEKFLNGLKMRSVVLAVTYTGSKTEAE